MTLHMCTNYCSSLEYSYAAITRADECYCGNKLETKGPIMDVNCDMPCVGGTKGLCFMTDIMWLDFNLMCGGLWQYSIFYDDSLEFNDTQTSQPWITLLSSGNVNENMTISRRGGWL
jgi:hypothetical protein